MFFFLYNNFFFLATKVRFRSWKQNLMWLQDRDVHRNWGPDSLFVNKLTMNPSEESPLALHLQLC